MKSLSWFFPRRPLEWALLAFGAVLVSVLGFSEFLTKITLGKDPESYRLALLISDLSLYPFPNSLFIILDPMIGLKSITYLLISISSVLVFVPIGKYLSSEWSGLRVLGIGIVYFAISTLSYILNSYIFLRFFYMQP